jgi:diaminopimelate epimerase
MSGNGNDFIVFDNRSRQFTGQESEFFKIICKRRFSIGADGVILIEKGDWAPVRMRYFNSNGFEAEMCANGARCLAYLIVQRSILPNKSFVLEASDGVHQVSVEKEEVNLKLQVLLDFQQNLGILQNKGLKEGGLLTVGVPHYVLFSSAIEDLDVTQIAPFYRNNSVFPNGANVNFVQIHSNGELSVRTYERGVEDETLSCGTGCVASALVASREWDIHSPVLIHTRGGDLTVRFDPGWKNVYLKGPVEIAFEGEIACPD